MDRNCIACGNRDLKLKYFQVPDYEYETYRPVDFFICSKCGLISQIPTPQNKDIHLFYPKEYRNHFSYSKGYFYKKLKQFQLWWFASKLEKLILDEKHNKDVSILEIGCGSGALLFTLKDKGFLNLYGNDILSPVDKMLAENNIEFKRGDAVRKFPFRRKFDVIILNHVFEHLSDPRRVLGFCKDNLNKYGKVIIVMPNSDSFAALFFKDKWDGLNAPRHFFIFTPKSMEELKKELGFRAIKFFTMPDPLNWSISFQNMLQGTKLFKTRLKNGLAWYTIPCGLVFTPIALLSKIGNKSAGMLYVLE